MKTVLFLLIISGLLILLNMSRPPRPRNKPSSRKPEDKPEQDPAADAKAIAPAVSEKCNCQHGPVEPEHPLIKVINLTSRIDFFLDDVEALPEDPATLSERRILKEQVRMATFERDLLLSVLTGHHPNPSAINTDWCFTSAELYLKFARDRLDRIS